MEKLITPHLHFELSIPCIQFLISLGENDSFPEDIWNTLMKETYVLWLLNFNCMPHIVSPQRWWQMKFFAPTQLASMIYFRCFSRGRGIDGSYLLRKEGSYHLLKPQWQSKFYISSEWRLTHSSFWAIIGHLTGENGVICFGDKSKGSYHLCHDMTSRIYFHHPLSFSKLWWVVLVVVYYLLLKRSVAP